VNFQDNATRKTGAISYLLYTSFGMSSNNTVRRAKFINAKPVYFPPMEHKWSNDDYGNGSYKTAVFHDVDGSVSGVPDSYILINDKNDGIVVDNSCVIKPTWNAAVCKGDIGRLSVGGPGGPGVLRGFPGLRGFGGAPGAGPGRGAPAGPGAATGPRTGARPVPVMAASRGGPGAPAGRPRGRGGPPQPPVILSRDGKEVTLAGATNIRAGTEIEVTTKRPTVALRLSELDKGSSVIFELPGFATAAPGTSEGSLAALRKASATSYYKGKDALWVKVVSNGEGARISGPGAGGTSVQVSR
jgi:cell migration-inducing and hyaluronan-binding protein